MSDWSNIWFILQFLFFILFFSIIKAWLLMFLGSLEKARLYESLWLIEKKGNYLMQYKQYNGKGHFLRFLYWVSPMPMETACIQFSCKVHKSSGSVSLKVVSATFLLVCFLNLKNSTYETRKNIFYFTSKALFVLKKKVRISDQM